MVVTKTITIPKFLCEIKKKRIEYFSPKKFDSTVETIKKTITTSQSDVFPNRKTAKITDRNQSKQ
jgi:hypothetical protein